MNRVATASRYCAQSLRHGTLSAVITSGCRSHLGAYPPLFWTRP